MLFLTMAFCFLSSLLLTPLIRKLAIKIGATDQPNSRKVHTKVMPRLGGLSIFLSTLFGVLLLQPDNRDIVPILLGSSVIVITGILDDLYELSAKIKLLGQLIAAGIVISGGIYVKLINLPFDIVWHLGILSIPVTIVWIILVTNSINLIDGLDGLAAGVSSIVLLTIAVMAYLNLNNLVFIISLIVLASTLGFLPYNFHPAKIFMGDTGALYLGFIISVISLLGFKNITTVSLIIPIIILGVPLSDTFFAVVRRIVNKKPLSTPDKSHIHHCFIELGFSHKKTVLLIYLLSGIFGVAAIIFERTTLWGSFLVIGILLVFIELIVEFVGLVDKNYRPIINLIQRVLNTR
ncbi:glycosyltransferase family 4 protein [Bacillus suaedaesalsae]|uniref:Undecaprenyl/decaprenyl-phosphate alpha-N-acetylglucosaminyl 1-phosphate transferase n=1 Tax=Bacillus suaedaesalsae TaxID=2810349 RepID=A0ABS2DKT0_9BACI|nr:MraY family glycosyltransferase [Bacillus suaedaesalsae]MBM6619073.1 undecaprenyl/decaprenyl-phosphate alpha-N-acetylglucosaminyl 1-phosphate transferase [Bacillus suaedaesalsae]